MNKTSTSLRAQSAALTQDRIMQGLSTILRRGDEVTFDILAVDTGIPVRTLYRYFPSKDLLFAAFWPWLNALIEAPARPTSPDEVVDHISELFAAFDRDEPLVRAMLHHPIGQAVRLANAEARRGKFADALGPVTATLSETEAGHLLAAVTALCSASGWESMKDNWGLSGAAAANAAQWAVRALINEARGHSRGGSD